MTRRPMRANQMARMATNARSTAHQIVIDTSPSAASGRQSTALSGGDRMGAG